MAKFLFVFLAISAAVVLGQDHSGTNYNAGDSGRSETRNPDGSVQGQYSYTDPNGKLITIKYRAGKDGYQVEGDHLPKAPAVPQANAPAQHNPHNYQPAPQQHSAQNYNPFHNPHVPDHLYQQAPQAPQQQQYNNPAPQVPQHTAENYNPFHNPHVPAHLYQQAPQAPAAPQVPQVPQHTAENYNPFHNPHVPAHLYQQAPQAPQQQYNNPAPQQQYNNQPSSFPGFGNQQSGFSHPNSIPGAPSGRGPVKVSVSQQPQGFTYNFETS